MIPGLRIIHSTKEDGNLSYFYGTPTQVQHNRQKFLAKHSLKFDDCIAARLTHSTNIVIVEKVDAGRGMHDFDSGVDGDAMITNQPATLFLLSADCIPMVIYDPVHKILTLAHVSTNNSTNHFTHKIIEHLQKEFSVDPQQLFVYFGPSIHQASYVKPTAKFTPSMLAHWTPYSRNVGADQIAIDLIGYNIKELLESGVSEAKIESNPVDTYNSPLYFSHQRSQLTGEPEGRFATLVSFSS